MKYRTLFRLLLKTIGVLIIANHIPTLLYPIRAILGVWTGTRSAGCGCATGIGGVLLDMIPTVLQVAVGLYLFFDGEWVINKAIPRNPPFCFECGRDLTGLEGHCPGCGTPFGPEDIQPAR